MRYIKPAILLSCSLFFLTQGLVRAQVKELENNAAYMSLINEEKLLSIREDSIQGVISETRRLFREDAAGRSTYSDRIMKLEAQIYEIRKSKGVLTGKINAIEQEFLLGSMRIGEQPATVAIAEAADSSARDGADTSTVNLVYARAISDLIQGKDYDNLLLAQNKEALALSIAAAYAASFEKQKALEAEYMTVAKEADALAIKAKFDGEGMKNTRLSDSLKNVWGFVFDTKLYSYNYLLDKMNKSGKLSDMDSRLGQMRHKLAEEEAERFVQSLLAYHHEKRFIQEYELVLAGEFRLPLAADSITRQADAFDTLNYRFEKLTLKERVFIDYEDAKINKVHAYGAGKPIPENKVYSVGTVYKVLVGTFSRAQDPSIFRRVSPLSWAKVDGKWQYYAGAYPTREEAEMGRALLAKAGFLRPKLVVWHDGAFETVADGASGGNSAQAEEGIYRVEISGADETLSQDIRAAITSIGGGSLEVGRVASSEGGFTFVVGNFDSRAQAQKLVDAVAAAGDGYSTKIVRLEP